MTRALIFDSGVGGLSVAAEIRKRLPDLAMDYVADDAFRPYGDKTPAQLRARLPGLIATLAHMLTPDIIVIACNTASTTALAQIRAAVTLPVIGVVPAVKPAAARTQTGTIGVLGTPATIRQRYVDDLISNFAANTDVRLLGSTRLVSLAEDKLEGRPVDPDLIRAEIALLFADRRGADIDMVVLACTHFPLLRDELAGAAPQSVTWIDSGQAIARRVEQVLGTPPQAEPRKDHAFLMGPAPTQARRKAFAAYGFIPTIGLEDAV